MRDTKFEKPLITTGIIMVVAAVGMASYASIGMLNNPVFLGTPAGAGWIEYHGVARD